MAAGNYHSRIEIFARRIELTEKLGDWLMNIDHFLRILYTVFGLGIAPPSAERLRAQ